MNVWKMVHTYERNLAKIWKRSLPILESFENSWGKYNFTANFWVIRCLAASPDPKICKLSVLPQTFWSSNTRLENDYSIISKIIFLFCNFWKRSGKKLISAVQISGSNDANRTRVTQKFTLNMSLSFPSGTIHKGRPPKSRDFWPPPHSCLTLSTLHTWHHFTKFLQLIKNTHLPLICPDFLSIDRLITLICCKISKIQFHEPELHIIAVRLTYHMSRSELLPRRR